MRQRYISPATKAVNIRYVQSIMTTSRIGVSSEVYNESSMTDLARDEAWDIWGCDEDDE